MSTQAQPQEVMEMLNTLDECVAEMLPRPNDPSSGERAADAVRTFAGAVGKIETFLKQLQQLTPPPQGPLAAQEQELANLQAELEEKDRLIAHARSQIARWQDVIQQQEQLQENTLFAGLGS
ncbi:hypothetical protein Agub_g8663 [Astrephomene gubernaculifera]|uniref:Uncharacterized protein n=1 Tax=Astrephomene gubernaculifera TaxID=47775 RepID=A0AAD3DUY0_9CHLO|nr:hypothetical protein Agub_g8663 [Astrephomene gubernaculifera]